MEASQVMGVPLFINDNAKVHKFCIEVHGDLGIPRFKKPTHTWEENHVGILEESVVQIVIIVQNGR